jgi:hypothetical protein
MLERSRQMAALPRVADGRLAQTRTTVWRFVLLAGCALLTVVPVGCGKNSGPERVAVSGTVKYNGTLIPDGAVRFVPGATSDAPATGVNIVDGKYNAAGRFGVPVGTFVVQIEAYRMHGPASSPPSKFDKRDQYLPAKFNAKSTLEFVVPSGSRQIAKDFDLKD